MWLVPDTSIFVADFQRRSSDWELLTTVHKRLDIRLAVPEVVFRETLAKYGERVDDAIAQATSATRTLRKLIGRDDSSLGIESAKEVKKYSQSLRRLTTHTFRGRLLPLPEVSHRDALTRALERKKPFKAAGEKSDGYRDFLIWRSVVELAKKEELCFVSLNVRDFCDADKSLHGDLLAELDQAGVQRSNVHFFDSLPSFATKWVRPKLEEVAVVEQQLKNDTHPQLRLAGLQEVVTNEIQGDTLLEEVLVERVIGVGGSGKIAYVDLDRPQVHDVRVIRGARLMVGFDIGFAIRVARQIEPDGSLSLAHGGAIKGTARGYAIADQSNGDWARFAVDTLVFQPRTHEQGSGW